jgi:predicted TIM-barrel fold metal-dependent hydrolase
MSFTIDVHHHILPDFFWSVTNDAHGPVGGTADTTRAIAQLHYRGALARTPNVKYIVARGGGTIPYLATRFSIVDEMNIIPDGGEPGPAADTLRRLYWDTAMSYRDPMLRMLREVVGMDQVLFGSDFPYLRRDLAVNCARILEQTTELAADERKRVMSGNAIRLFPRFVRRAPERRSRPTKEITIADFVPGRPRSRGRRRP